MGQSLVKNLVHLVFSTKHRTPWIPPDIRARLYAYQAGIFRECESPPTAEKNRGRGEKGEFQMDENERRNEQSRVSLAKRIRRVFRKPIQRRRSAQIHRESGKTSSQNDVSG